MLASFHCYQCIFTIKTFSIASQAPGLPLWFRPCWFSWNIRREWARWWRRAGAIADGENYWMSSIAASAIATRIWMCQAEARQSSPLFSDRSLHPTPRWAFNINIVFNNYFLFSFTNTSCSFYKITASKGSSSFIVCECGQLRWLSWSRNWFPSKAHR